MKIHCFYNDLVLSLRSFFDRVIFPGGVIKNYQFNFGNRSIQVKYDTKFELPSIIINYRTSRPMFYHPFTIQKSPVGMNCNTIPVLYDYNKRLTLLLHEETFEFNIEVLINCESQLSALQLEHTLQNSMVLNKFLHFYKFYSFLEIDQRFINSDMFDVNNDHILNLYQKYNRLNDTTDHCFAVQYKPLLRMDNVDIQLGSTEQRSFQVVLGLTMMNPVPVYLEIPPIERGVQVPSIHRNIDNVIVSTGIYPVLGIKLWKTKDSNPVVGAVRLSNVEFPEDPNDVPLDVNIVSDFTITNNDDLSFNGTVYGTLTGINYICKVKAFLDSATVVCTGIIHTNYETGITSLQIFGPLEGKISRATLESDGPTPMISGSFFGFAESKRSPISRKVRFEYDVDTTYFSMEFKSIDIDQDIARSRVDMVPSGNINNIIPEINSRLLKPKCDEIRIRKIIILCGETTERELYPTTPCFCDPVGNFSFSVEVFNDDGVSREATISGKIHPETLELYYSVAGMHNYFICDGSLEVLSFVFDFTFDSSVGFGARFIESINIDFLDDSHTIASSYGAATHILSPDESSLGSERKIRVLRSRIISDTDIAEDFKIYDDHVGITITLDVEFDYDKLIQENKKIGWVFYCSSNLRIDQSSYRFDNYCKEIQLKERTGETPHCILEFTLDQQIYNKIFANVTVDNPVFFQIFVEEGV